MRSLALRLTRRAATSARAPLAATVLATRRAAAAAAAAASRAACRMPLASSARSMATAAPSAGAVAAAAAAKPKRDKPAEPAPVVLPAPASVAAALAQSGAPLQHVTVGTHPASPYAVAVTLNRPALHNAFNEHVISELTRAFRAVRTAVESDNKNSTSAPVRCVVLGAHGKSFSAGADLSWMKAMAGYSHDENKVDSHKLFDMFASIFDCPVPVIGRVNGAAMGGGSGLVAACDFSFALSAASFAFTEVKLGLIPAVISPYVMSKIGRGHASRYFLTGEKFDGAEAVRIGLVQKHVATPAELDALVDGAVKEIVANSPAAVRRAKQLIETVATFNGDATVAAAANGQRTTTPQSPLSTQMKETVAEQIASIRVSAEGQEGLKAFFDKRAPAWRA